MFSISNSTIKSFLHCRKKYSYAYVQEIEPKIPRIQLYRGELIHEMLDLFHRGEDYNQVIKKAKKFVKRLLPREIEEYEYGTLVEDLERIITGYIRKWKKDGLVTIATELDLEVILVKDRLRLTGRLDRLFKDKNGFLWFGDTKTHKVFPSEESRIVNTQFLIYMYLLLQNGYKKVAGGMWDYIRTFPPKPPQILKNGTPTVSKHLLGNCTYRDYRDTLSDLRLDPADYEEILQWIKTNNEDRFYKRIYLPVEKKMVMEFVNKDLIPVATEMMIYHEKTEAGKPITYVRNIGDFNCRGCGFKPLCFGEMMGDDVKFIRKREYKKREKTQSVDIPVKKRRKERI